MTETRGLAVVVGGTKGLGRALSLQFGKNGFEVLATYSTDHQAARELEDVFQARGIPGACLNHDATGRVPLPVQPHSNLVLIYNVSADFVPAPFHLIRDEEFRRQYEGSVIGFVNILKSLLRGMVRARNGTVITVLSTALEDQPPKGFAAYVSGKSALMGLTKALASEYGNRGIRFFSVSPGFMGTAFSAAWDPSLKNSILEAQGGILDPEDVATFTWQCYATPGEAGSCENFRVLPNTLRKSSS